MSTTTTQYRWREKLMATTNALVAGLMSLKYPPSQAMETALSLAMKALDIPKGNGSFTLYRGEPVLLRSGDWARFEHDMPGDPVPARCLFVGVMLTMDKMGIDRSSEMRKEEIISCVQAAIEVLNGPIPPGFLDALGYE